MNSISLKNLSVIFSDYAALDNITAEFPENSFISIVGPNGAGKTTLLKTLVGLIEPSSGSILVLGKPPKEHKTNEIGYVPQLKTLDRSFPALSSELVATGIRSAWVGRLTKDEKALIEAALEQVGALHLLRKPLSQLSGGEMQRIYLARSIVRKPKILILDEPVTGIDRLGISDIHKIIDEYKNLTHATIIMVTHDWESAYHHSDLVFLLNRTLISFASPGEAFADMNIRKTYDHVGHRHEMIFGVHEHD